MTAYQMAADYGADTIVAALITHAVTAGELADCVWQVVGWRVLRDQERREHYPHLVPANVLKYAEMRRSSARKRYRLRTRAITLHDRPGATQPPYRCPDMVPASLSSAKLMPRRRAHHIDNGATKRTMVQSLQR